MVARHCAVLTVASWQLYVDFASETLDKDS